MPRCSVCARSATAAVSIRRSETPTPNGRSRVIGISIVFEILNLQQIENGRVRSAAFLDTPWTECYKTTAFLPPPDAFFLHSDCPLCRHCDGFRLVHPRGVRAHQLEALQQGQTRALRVRHRAADRRARSNGCSPWLTLPNTRPRPQCRRGRSSRRRPPTRRFLHSSPRSRPAFPAASRN